MDFFQKSLFDAEEDNSKKSQEIKANLSDIMISRFQKYTLTDYIADIEQNGLSQTSPAYFYDDDRYFLKRSA